MALGSWYSTMCCSRLKGFESHCNNACLMTPPSAAGGCAKRKARTAGYLPVRPNFGGQRWLKVDQGVVVGVERSTTHADAHMTDLWKVLAMPSWATISLPPLIKHGQQHQECVVMLLARRLIVILLLLQ